MEKTIPIVGRAQLKARVYFLGSNWLRMPKPLLNQVFNALLKEGVLVMLGGNSFRLYPALNIDPKIAKNGIRIIERVLSEQSKVLKIPPS
jgi:acetylornithine/succinyldiaminopimelate/putrescine aminotransferase